MKQRERQEKIDSRGAFERVVMFVILWCIALMGGAPYVSAASRGIGPYRAQTRQGPAMLVLLRRDGDTVWVERKTRSGAMIEAGMPVSDILAFDIPPSKLYEIAERITTKESAERVRQALRQYAASFKPYRDIPGIPADRAVFEEGRLNVRVQDWHKALSCFNELMGQTYPSEILASANCYAGICLVELGKYEEALPLLSMDAMTDDDLELLSMVYFARGKALEGVGDYEQAALSYLYPVVFYPYVNRNEARGLAAVLPCYVAMKDWDALLKTWQALVDEYPGDEETLRAGEYYNTFQEHMDREKDFQIEDNKDEKKRERIEIL
ncbi:MAG: tetratricopeptide repeat protein [Spartobacteria bacterium]|nr:tetratricopeptide repeat protein [Spartobacteria bacterium]